MIQASHLEVRRVVPFPAFTSSPPPHCSPALFRRCGRPRSCLAIAASLGVHEARDSPSRRYSINTGTAPPLGFVFSSLLLPSNTKTARMKAAMYYGAKDIRIEEVEVPRPKPGQVQIKIAWYVGPTFWTDFQLTPPRS